MNRRLRRRRPITLLVGLGLVAVAVAAASCSSGQDTAATTTTSTIPLDEAMALNQIQVIGSHNSYHVSNYDQIKDVSPLAVTLDYTHQPLAEQLDGGLRSLELDVWLQDDGALHVLHFPGFDPISVCDRFTECLTELRDWSTAHPDHVPIGILVEVKATAEELGAHGIDQIDEEIRSVFDERSLITPDDVRGDRPTLADAVPDGWPTLAEARGRVMFAMDNEDGVRDLYAEGRPSLEGRVLFTSSARGRPDAAFIKLNDPVVDRDKIRRLIAAGYIVRTRADSDVLGAVNGDTVGRRRAFASGAQWVSTDFPATEPPARSSGYTVEFPDGGFTRCNVVNGPERCTDADLEPEG